MKYNINFSEYFKKFNFLSLILIIISLIFMIFKGLNYGIDFKGGTLIEVRLENKNTEVSKVRESLKKINLGDINVKNFGEKGDFLIKIEKKLKNNDSLISEIKSTLDLALNEYLKKRQRLG